MNHTLHLSFFLSFSLGRVTGFVFIGLLVLGHSIDSRCMLL